MASKDTDVAGKHGRERRRDLGDGTTADVAIVANADGIPATEATPIPVLVIDPLIPAPIPAVSVTHGDNIHLANGSFSGPPNPIYDADAVLWDASAPVGPASFTAVSNEQSHSGANSAKWSAPNEGDTIQFAKPTPPEVLTGNVALTFWIYISGGYSTGDSIEVYGWDGGVVGIAVAIEPKIDIFGFDEWQLVSISLAELGLETASIDAIRLQYVTKSGPAPTVYIDDVAIQSATGAEMFFIAAPPGFEFHLSELVVTYLDDLDTTEVAGTLPGFDPTRLLGEPALTNGFLFQLTLNGVLTPVQGVAKCIFDYLYYGFRLSAIAKDGLVGVQLTLKLPHPIVLSGAAEDNNFGFIVRDDYTVFRRVHTVGLGGLRLL